MVKNKYFIIVFIPAIGNCHQIPRKFLRSLNGSPLINFSIEFSKQITSAKNIAVINDDEEIDLAAKRLDVRTHYIKDRNSFPRKFGEEVTLKLLDGMESAEGRRCDFVIWLGPSSPLLRARDLRDAVAYLESSNFDAVFSASEEPQRSWVYSDTYQPSFIEVSNDFKTGWMHKETGAFFIMRRESISSEGYIGLKGGPYYLPQAHSLEINTFNDWWIAEKLLKRKQILFVVSGYPAIGLGHVYRTLMLAQELNNHEVQFLCTHNSGMAFDYIKQNLYPGFIQQDNESLLDSVLKISPDVVINDILDTSKDYMCSLKNKGIKIINFEDEGDGVRYADIVINALYVESKFPNMLAGYKYFCLRNEFLSARQYSVREKVKNVLITFGGTDYNNLTLRILKLITPLAQSNDFDIIIITGPGYSHQSALKNYLGNNSNETEGVVTWVPNGTRQISEYMADADFAITSAGRTVFELAALRVPSIIIAANQRELSHSFGLEAGQAFLGYHAKISNEQITSSMQKHIYDVEYRRSISLSLERFDLTEGKNNIINEISKVVETT